MAPTVEERRLRVLIAKKEKLFEFIQNLYDLSGRLSDERARVKFQSLVGSLGETKSELMSLVDEVNMLQLELDEKSKPNFDILNSVHEMCGHILIAEKSLKTSVIEGVSLVHENPKLSKADKLYFLMGCLKDQAKSICSGLTMAAENYDVVWDMLIQRYHDTRALANAYLGQLLDWRDAREESEKGLNSFLENYASAVRALRNLKLRDLADYIFLYHALSRLNSETVNYFEINRGSDSVPQFEELLDFVKLRVKTLASTKVKVPGKFKELDGPRFKISPKAFLVNEKNIADSNARCGYCGRLGHEPSECKGFLSLSPYTRYVKVKEFNLCYNCLSAEHGVRSCPSSKRCEDCQLKHHRLIHHDRPESGTTSSAAPKREGVSLHSTPIQGIGTATTVLLGTVKVVVEGTVGSGEGRFLLDNGSQANLVSYKFCKRLGLPVSKLSSSIQGLGGISQPVRGQTTFTIRSRFRKGRSFSVKALVLEKITGKLPQSQVNLRKCAWLEGLPLADSTFDHPGAVEGIFGAELFANVMGTDHRKGGGVGPIAMETALGYVVMGQVPAERRVDEQRTFVSILGTPAVEELVQRFWEVEAIPETPESSTEDDPCEEIFRREVFREETGRFTVALPFKVDPGQLGDSRGRAKKRFFALESRLEKNLELKRGYQKAMADLIDQGQVIPVVDQLLEAPAYHIPHHAVYKPNSESTPVRIVFDASAPSDSGLSLNSILHSGPKLQADIGAILIQFRLFPVALVSDIRQMYRQIDIIQPHRRFQRLFWRWEPSEPLKLWELRTLAFGVTSSPYLALRCVQQLLQEESPSFPKTAGLVRSNLYMDDLVVSVPSVEEAEELYSEAVALFKRGQFDLMKWTTNSGELLEKIPVEKRVKGDRLVTFGAETSVLGVMWDPREDNILIKFPVPATECTKRAILSSVARCFDPLGLAAPLVLYLKVLVKEMWSSKLDWDEQAPPAVQRRWNRIHSEWSSLEELKVYRSLDADRNTAVTLFGFADASKDGYGGVIYLQKTRGDSVLQLVSAKSKVSPMKAMSIPRLELSAAVLLVKLMAYVSKILKQKIRIEKIFLFSDSSTVLQWITGEGSKDTFVRNRLTQIKETLPEANWRHISGKENPADGLSRGLSPVQLVEHKLWFQGPTWVQWPEEEWPCSKPTPAVEELAVLTAVQQQTNEPEVHPLLELVDRRSSWSEILRITVWVLRWVKRIPKGTTISASDLLTAERTLVILVQRKHFGEDMRLLQDGKDPSHRLRSLQPFLRDGALRVGGRLANSSLSFENRHPLILPKGECLTERIIDHYHLKYLHTGSYLLEALLRRKFWILAGRSLIKKRVRVCNKCFRVDPKPVEPLMANLPEQRVNPSRAFSETGVDYFGPINITLGRKRGSTAVKAYVALFVCMSVKAIHLELVSSLSTDHFLQAFKRFLARRGSCKTLYSDRGTNFMGARRVLSEVATFVQSKEYQDVIGKEIAERRIQWKFNPPAAPHMGGIWESQVKVVKKHLTRVIGEQLLSYEELNTLLVQVEALLNSRPLCQLSADPAAPSALTPAHFLQTSPLEELPADDVLDVKIGRLNRFQLLDQMVQSFWKRWKLEYLTTLQARHRWTQKTGNLRVGTVVVLRVESSPPLRWPLAVITEVFPGRDGVVRTVKLRCGQKDLIRPVVKVCPLPSQ